MPDILDSMEVLFEAVFSISGFETEDGFCIPPGEVGMQSEPLRRADFVFRGQSYKATLNRIKVEQSALGVAGAMY